MVPFDIRVNKLEESGMTRELLKPVIDAGAGT
jgi:hypothetical protein